MSRKKDKSISEKSPKDQQKQKSGQYIRKMERPAPWPDPPPPTPKKPKKD